MLPGGGVPGRGSQRAQPHGVRPQRLRVGVAGTGAAPAGEDRHRQGAPRAARGCPGCRRAGRDTARPDAEAVPATVGGDVVGQVPRPYEYILVTSKRSPDPGVLVGVVGSSRRSVRLQREGASARGASSALGERGRRRSASPGRSTGGSVRRGRPRPRSGYRGVSRRTSRLVRTACASPESDHRQQGQSAAHVASALPARRAPSTSPRTLSVLRLGAPL